MKRTILFSTLVAIITSVLTTLAIMRLGPAWKTIRIEHIDSKPVSGVLYSKNNTGEFTPVDFTQTADKVMPAVVHIRSTVTNATAKLDHKGQENIPDQFKDFFGDDMFKRFFGPQYQYEGPENPGLEVSTGSGVIINSDGYIITNNHVIADANDIDVTLYDNRSYKATVIGVDPTTDLAVLQIKEKNLPSLLIVNSDDVKVGEWVMAVGNPFNLNSTVTAGIVSAKSRNINILKEKYAIESFIQTDAAINPGNSGGALVDLQGGLIGINTAIASPTGSYSGYGFAVPSNLVSKVVEDILKYGTVQRGYLGVNIRSVDADLSKDKKLDLMEGVYVDSVLENSAAKIADVRGGDVITKVDGTIVNNSSQLQEIIARHKPGDEVTLNIRRKGTDKNIAVVLKNREGMTETIVKERSAALNTLGAEFEAIDKKTADKLGLDGGVKVSRLFPGKLRQQTNMKEGFIITSVDGKPIRNVEDVEKALAKKEGGVLIEGIYEDAPGKVYYGFGM